MSEIKLFGSTLFFPAYVLASEPELRALADAALAEVAGQLPLMSEGWEVVRPVHIGGGGSTTIRPKGWREVRRAAAGWFRLRGGEIFSYTEVVQISGATFAKGEGVLDSSFAEATSRFVSGLDGEGWRP